MPRPEDGGGRAGREDRARVGRVEADARLRLRRRLLALAAADLGGVQRAVAERVAVPHAERLRRVVLGERDEVARVGRHVHRAHAVRVGRRDRLHRRPRVRVPHHEHRAGAAVGGRRPPAVGRRARARDRVDVALEQPLRLRRQVVQHARVRRRVQHRRAVGVAQVLQRDVAREAEDPLEGHRRAVGRRAGRRRRSAAGGRVLGHRASCAGAQQRRQAKFAGEKRAAARAPRSLSLASHGSSLSPR